MSLQVVQALVDLGRLEAALGEATGVLGGVECVLEMVDVSVERPQLVVVLLEPDDVGKDSPVVEVGGFDPELREKSPRAREKLAEPERHGLEGAHMGRSGGGEDFGDVGLVFGTERRPEHGHSAVVEAFDPLGGAVQSVAGWDDQARVAAVVGDVPLGGAVEPLRGLADAQVDVAAEIGHLALEGLNLTAIFVSVLGILPVPLAAGGKEAGRNGGDGGEMKSFGVLQDPARGARGHGSGGSGAIDEGVDHPVELVLSSSVAL